MTALTLVLSLTAFVDKSVSRDPAVAAARAAAEQAALLRREVSAAALPRLSAKASYLRSDDPLFPFDTRTAAALEAGVPLFTGFQSSSARRRTALSAAAAAAGLRAVTEDRRRAAVDAWLEARAAAGRAAVLAERAASAAAMLEEAKNLVKSGLVLGSDFHAASALSAKLEGQSAFEARRREGAKARMAVLAGEAAEPAGGFGGLPPPLEDAAALAAATADRGDLAAGRLAAAAAQEGARAASRSLLPRVEGFASVQDAGRGFLDGGTSRLVGLRAELPFGDPAYYARRDGARAGATHAAASARAAEEDAAASVAFGRASYAGAAEAFPLFVQARDAARRSLELVRPLYRQGRQSVLEVLRAEDALAQAELAVIEARIGLASGWAGLRRGAGRLDAAAVAALEASLEAKP